MTSETARAIVRAWLAALAAKAAAAHTKAA